MIQSVIDIVPFDTCRSTLQDHLLRLTNQMLRKKQLDPNWAELVSTVGRAVTNSVRLNARLEDEMDIRHFVKIKKVWILVAVLVTKENFCKGIVASLVILPLLQ